MSCRDAVGVALDRAEEHDARAARQHVLQERLVEPERLQEPAAPVLEPHLVEREAPRAPQPGDRDLARDGDPHPRPQVRDAHELPPVLVPHRQVEQQVERRPHAELRERLRALRADALDELDGRLEIHSPPILPRRAAPPGPSRSGRRRD